MVRVEPLKLAEVQEACSIIQNAAHEDANIIFGAVLDEKMKDAVKITVIATGFKDEDRPRRRTESTGFTVNTGADDFDSEPSPSPTVMESAQPAPAASAEVISLDGMRNAMIANFEQADLDVPAFLRKRGDAM
jgi:cell division protein FtsZ